MKTKNYSAPAIMLMVFFACRLQAQCGLRYQDSIFQYSISTVVYDSYDSAMDIYQPVGDTSSMRPLIIMAHEGTFVGGTKTSDPTVLHICQNYAARGYVTASINYRLLSPTQLIEDVALGDTTAIINEVIQALSDGKAAVRYFFKDADSANKYRIDTNKIFMGGNSAGAVLAMHYGYIDSIGQCTQYLQGIINQNGGLEGNSGNAGYSSKIAAVISCAGGLNDPNWVTPGSMPSFNIQGTADDVVPYYCGNAEGGEIPVRLCGLGSLQPFYTAGHVLESSLVIPGAPHVAWDTSESMYYSLDSALSKFLIANFVTPDSVCNSISAISEVPESVEISMFPNPASEVVNVRSSAAINNVDVYDETGRKVAAIVNLNTFNFQMNTSAFAKGVYSLRFNTVNSLVPPDVKRLVIE